MRPNSVTRALTVALMAFLAALTIPRASHADFTVAAGYDLFQSGSETNFMGVDFKGVPLGNFNFGGTIGIQNTNPTDTIIQRTQAATVSTAGDSAAVNLQVLALQLESTNPVNLAIFGGSGTGNAFLTLSTTHQSTGTMSITFAGAAGGTFTSSLDLFFDIRTGGLNGNILQSEEATLTNSGASWGRTPPAGTVKIPGVNLNLNGVDNAQDFWVQTFEQGKINQGGQQVGTDDLADAAVPEPASIALIAIGGVCLAAYAWRRRKTRALPCCA